MLGWLFPRPPVRPAEKAWIEYRTKWLIDQLGTARFLSAEMILPTDDFFPDEYRGDNADAERMFRRVCRYLQVDPQEMRFEVCPDDNLPDAVGLYDRSDENLKPAIRVAASQIEDPEALVATLAHEVAHHILLGGQLLTGEEDDHEWTTDLLPCIFGVGIFAANSTVRYRQVSDLSFHWVEASRSGYMPSHALGYALALAAWLRGERRPTWMHHLRLDAREAMSLGLRYLRRTDDCFIRAEQLGHANRPNLVELTRQLHHGTSSAKILALWELADRDDGKTESPHVRSLIHDRSADVRRTAIETAVALKLDDNETTSEVTRALRDSNAHVRIKAAHALGAWQPEGELVVGELGRMLSDTVPEVKIAAAWALQQLGPRSASTESHVLAALHAALIDCEFSLTDMLVEILRQSVSDAGQSINDYFAERDGEFRQAAIDALYNSADPEIMYDDPPAQ